jgi:small G protein signaling modulator 3
MTRWLISLFVNHLPLDAELAVWDLFMIKGVNVLFRVAITLFQLMQEDILKCQDMCEIKMSIEEFAQKVNRDTLLKQLFVGIKTKEIEKLRANYKAEII